MADIQQPQLILFSASRDQKAYFSKLQAKLPFPTLLLDYKRLPKVFMGKVPSEVVPHLQEQVALLLTRKQNTAKGQKRGRIYWVLNRWWQVQRAKRMFRQAVAVLKQHEAPFLGVWNGKKFRQAIWVVAAKSLGKQVVYFERGPLPGYSMVDAFGVNAASGNPRERAFYQQYACHLAENVAIKIKKGEKPEGMPVLFVPFQVVEDSNIYMHSPWIRHMRQLFSLVEKLSEAYPHWEFWLKEHPACNEAYPDLHEQAKKHGGKIRFVNEYPSAELVEKATAVMTINSTVGMEALQAGKQVLVLGEALYAIEGLTQPIKTESELIENFEQKALLPVDEETVKHFICYLKQDYVVPGDAMQVTLEEKWSVHWECMSKKLLFILSGQPRKAIGLDE